MEPPERAAPKYNLICYIFAVYRRHIELTIAFESGGRRAVKLNIESVIRRKIRVHGVYGINELDFFIFSRTTTPFSIPSAEPEIYSPPSRSFSASLYDIIG